MRALEKIKPYRTLVLTSEDGLFAGLASTKRAPLAHYRRATSTADDLLPRIAKDGTALFSGFPRSQRRARFFFAVFLDFRAAVGAVAKSEVVRSVDAIMLFTESS